MIESPAYIDGAKRFYGLVWKVVLPLATPDHRSDGNVSMGSVAGMPTLTRFDFILQDRAKYPLQIILREILVQGQFGQDHEQNHCR